MNITCLAFGAVIIIFGILFFVGKLHKYFSFWKKMSFEERSKINIKAISHNIGLVLFVCGAILLAAGLWSFFYSKLFIWFMIGWVVITVMDFAYLTKSKRFLNNSEVIKK
ncbi:MAG: DUF3784 domain-containing protein [Coprobacillus sp.]|nr:DUF3784 domain-containing protein [Coprobacillus sp.]